MSDLMRSIGDCAHAFNSLERTRHPWRTHESFRGDFYLDATEGLGLVLARLGLLVRRCEIEQDVRRHKCLPTDDLVINDFVQHLGTLINLQTQLHPNALLTFKVPESGHGGVVLHLEHEDSTREMVAEEMVPVIIEQWRSQNGDFTHRSAALLGMLLMEMLWAAAS